jgi:hypothetical protein
MKRIVIESPYTATAQYSVEDNVQFARRCLTWAVLRGVAPLASHLLYTQPGVLDDSIPEERSLGIQAGLTWAIMASEAWFCLRPDEELSSGMYQAATFYRENGIMIRVFRFTPAGNFLCEEKA